MYTYGPRITIFVLNYTNYIALNISGGFDTRNPVPTVLKRATDQLSVLENPTRPLQMVRG